MRRFSTGEISAQNQMKASAQRAVRAAVLQRYPRLENVIDDIIPKKAPAVLAKCHGHIQLVVIDGEPRFFQTGRSSAVPPADPSALPRMRVDAGAVKFVLRGSNVMCPGLTSPGGRMENVAQGTVIQILAEGKGELACAVGIATMSSEEIAAVNKGICIENLHALGDGLWSTPRVTA